MPQSMNLTQKILAAHLVEGSLEPGSEIAIKPDQVLTQDATGTMVYLQFETTGLNRIKVDLGVSYIDHNLLQVGYENADDHRYLASVAAKFGVHLSRAGNGICHQIHLERFVRPGGFLLGSDSHTPTAGGAGMLGIGAGGLDVAVALAGAPYFLRMPRVVRVELRGRLRPWVAAKDVILELLRRLTVKGGVGCIFEYTGPGVATLSVYERATICNMGAELGATSSLFPSDERTREFFQSVGREEDWQPLEADVGADYDEEIVINLDELEPLIAQPHSPDNVVKVNEIAGMPVQQVVIGSCTNSSLEDMAIAAEILKGKVIPPHVSLVIAPGTRRILRMMIANGILDTLIESGARILEVGCGPCNGIGQSPASGSVSVRTVNRNYRGRSGTEDALVYIASPAVAAATALRGRITDPRELGDMPELKISKIYPVDDNLIVTPPPEGEKVEIVRGPNIKPVPQTDPLPDKLELTVMLKAGDNVSTDDIIPGGARLLSLRSNIPAMAEYTFSRLDSGFVGRVKEHNRPWMVVGGENFGQGSSREHAVLAPLYLGLKVVVAKSFARIYRQNLINYGVLPLILAEPEDYACISLGAVFTLERLRNKLLEEKSLVLEDKSKGLKIPVVHDLSQREVELILSGGLLRYVGSNN
ncbi:3-isopropylmalate dehydratase large subunit [Neomoorella glycerini]|uniref:3-isopropylmalate dehydratase large subunit n=2 Tax=Neomoorella glycerini TaxID=55779 RepID=A0A6I5ZN28_9FIRM|nr:3-isopropylmalate dehydratase large subunit [Moorella glycerini]